MLDFAALEMASRLVSEQFSEDRPVSDRPRRNSARKPVRTRAARGLRIVADACSSQRPSAAPPTEPPALDPGRMSRVVVHAQTKSYVRLTGLPSALQGKRRYARFMTSGSCCRADA